MTDHTDCPKWTDRMDGLLMDVQEILGLVFVCPRECLNDPINSYRHQQQRPGIYLRQHRPNKSPTASPSHDMVLLTKEQALDLASTYDNLADPTEHMRGTTRNGYPTGYTHLVAMWYEALGRRLARAVDATDARLTDLRVTRAAITGCTDA